MKTTRKTKIATIVTGVLLIFGASTHAEIQENTSWIEHPELVGVLANGTVSAVDGRRFRINDIWCQLDRGVMPSVGQRIVARTSPRTTLSECWLNVYKASNQLILKSPTKVRTTGTAYRRRSDGTITEAEPTTPSGD